ncbi:galactokinase-like [Octopus sinensis]|uniref:Galactokinase-like n=1 Tax=Octopus sinensis TaxID=2607531 RepID=A0A7E6EJR0_9MOLL|nr:galactokinase-like [Octopus sinensis]
MVLHRNPQLRFEFEGSPVKAISLATVIVGSHSHNGSSSITTLSPDISEPHFVTCSDLSQWFSPGYPKWTNYIKGVLVNFKDFARPFNLVVATSIPIGGGLSSSAALEVASYLFFEQLFLNSTKEPSLLSKALVCQKAEHNFAGTPCGIMDQLVSFCGKENHAIL